MGFSKQGKAVSLEDLAKHRDSFLQTALKQFVYQYQKHSQRSGDPSLWGDEIEYHLVEYDDHLKEVKLLLNGKDVVESATNVNLHIEGCSFQLESIPRKPFTGSLQSLCTVEQDMKDRRANITRLLSEQQYPISCCIYPRFGLANCSKFRIDVKNNNDPTRCVFPEEYITPDAKCRAIYDFIHNTRKNEDPYVIKVAGDPVTGKKGETLLVPYTTVINAAAAFQVTIQTDCLNDALLMYDQLAAFSPILLALSASSPALFGRLTEHDGSRWLFTKQAFSPTFEKTEGMRRISDSIESYISSVGHQYNDTPYQYREDMYVQLRNAGISEGLAKHGAFQFSLGPLMILEEQLKEVDVNDTSHLQVINMMCYQNVRLRWPDSTGGWKVEVRIMDVQHADSENAAYAIFVVLLSKLIMQNKLNFLIPISKLDENIQKACNMQAVTDETFFFRKQFRTDDRSENIRISSPEKEYAYMTVDEIINGKNGLLRLMTESIEHSECDVTIKEKLHSYLNLLSGRASGKLHTGASWIRHFVLHHPDYQHETGITDVIQFDILKKVRDISDWNMGDLCSFYTVRDAS